MRRPFEEFQVWGDNAGPEYDWDDRSRMFLPKTYNRSFVLPLQVQCVSLDATRSTWSCLWNVVDCGGLLSPAPVPGYRGVLNTMEHNVSIQTILKNWFSTSCIKTNSRWARTRFLQFEGVMVRATRGRVELECECEDLVVILEAKNGLVYIGQNKCYSQLGVLGHGRRGWGEREECLSVWICVRIQFFSLYFGDDWFVHRVRVYLTVLSPHRWC